MSRPRVEVYLGLGGNVGDRKKYLRRALDELEKEAEVRVLKRSSLYETSPLGPRQRNFLNQAVRIATSLGPFELLALLKRIEKRLGRKKAVRWGSRAIDLDILTYGRRRISSPSLTVPHPGLGGRRFVLEPLREIAPRLKPAGLGNTVSRLASQLTDPAQRVRLFTG